MRTDSPKEEIRRRVDIVALISRYVQLKRSGRRYRGRCPFHQERNPSFYVDPATGMWKCFGCGAAGDVFTFVQRIHNLTFAEAAEQLAAEVGVEWRPTRRDERGRSLRQAILRANELAARFFAEQLRKPVGARALEYLRGRGLGDDAIERFGLGYAPPDGRSLQRYLAARGISGEVIAKAGLVHSGGSDMFTDRVMFPVHDVTGRVIGFGGRALSDDEQAKYVNTPDTPVFHKGETLYGLNLARSAAGQEERLIIVEGYTDVISLHQAGIANVVASLGTALTPEHLKVASRYADEIVLAYDADAAGLQAALRDISMFEKCPAEVRIALLPEGHDPDSLVRELGAEAFRRAIEEARPAAEVKLRQVLSQDRAEARPEMLSQAAEILLDVTDRARRMEMLDRVADWWGGGDAARVGMMRRALWLEVRRRLRQRWRQERGEQSQKSPEQDDDAVIVQTVAQTQAGVSPGRERLERTLLVWALNDPEIARHVFRVVPVEAFSSPRYRPIARALARQVACEEFAPDQLPDELDNEPETQEALAELLLTEYAPPDPEELLASVDKLRALHLAGIDAVRWEPTCQTEVERDLPDVETIESLERLRAEVCAKLDRGEISPEDPIYQAYCRLASMLHGRGGVEYFEQHHIRRSASQSGRSRRARRGRGGGKG